MGLGWRVESSVLELAGNLKALGRAFDEILRYDIDMAS